MLNGAVVGTVTIEAVPKLPWRPRKYEDEVFYRICARIAMVGPDGKRETLGQICAEEGMPDVVTVFRWIAEDEAHARMWQCARYARYDALIEGCIEIADDGSDDLEMVNAEVNEETGATSIKVREKKHTLNRARLMIDTRFRVAAKALPRVYGEVAPMEAPPQTPGQDIPITPPKTIETAPAAPPSPLAIAVSNYLREEAAAR